MIADGPIRFAESECRGATTWAAHFPDGSCVAGCDLCGGEGNSLPTIEHAPTCPWTNAKDAARQAQEAMEKRA